MQLSNNVICLRRQLTVNNQIKVYILILHIQRTPACFTRGFQLVMLRSQRRYDTCRRPPKLSGMFHLSSPAHSTATSSSHIS
jgi:hypothetical protein